MTTTTATTTPAHRGYLLRDDEIRQITIALRTLLRRDGPAGSEVGAGAPADAPEDGPFPVLTVEQLTAMSRAECQTMDIIENLIGVGCSLAITVLGRRLHEMTGSLDEMLRVAEEVSGGFMEWEYRTDVLDKAWDGIGDWHAG